MTKVGTFDDLSQSIAKNFLQTAVVIDDLADYDLAMRPVAKPNLAVPIRQKRRSAETSAESIRPTGHELNARILTEGFAHLGLACSILKPVKDDPSASDLAISLGSKADLVIIDWNILQDSGATAKEIISSIFKKDGEQKRKRLICVYTGEQDISGISWQIFTHLVQGNHKEDTNKSNKFQLDSMTVIVLAKTETVVAAKLRSEVVGEADLPERLIKEFSEMSKGLVSNTALCAMSAIRANTHRLLSRLGSSMDAPFLAHRAMLMHPEESGEMLIAIIVAEIRAILDIESVSTTINTETLDKWLKYKMGENEGSTFKLKNVEYSFSAEDLRTLVVDGARGWIKLSLNGSSTVSGTSKGDKRKIFRSLSDVFSWSNDGINLDRNFAMMTSFGRWYDQSFTPSGSNMPKLSLGTIIELIETPGPEKDGASESSENPPNPKEEQPKYLLCTQPPCDSVRIPQDENNACRFFPFIPLYSVKNPEKDKFRLVIISHADLNNISTPNIPNETDGISAQSINSDSVDDTVDVIDDKAQVKAGETVYLQFVPKAYHQRMIEFKSNSQGFIESNISDGKVPIFEDKDGIKYRWVADLKFEHAQRAVQEFAESIARVGLDESEWLRRGIREDQWGI